MKLNARLRHKLPAPFDKVLVKLEAGDAIAEQSARLLIAVEDSDFPAICVQLGGSCESRWPTAYDRHALPIAAQRLLWGNPPFRKGRVNDFLFNLTDIRGPEALSLQATGSLAQRGADAAGEFRERTGFGESFPRITPIALHDGAVDVGDGVLQGTSHRMAVGKSAVLAAGGQTLHVGALQRRLHLQGVLYPFADWPIDVLQPGNIYKSSAHDCSYESRCMDYSLRMIFLYSTGMTQTKRPR